MKWTGKRIGSAVLAGFTLFGAAGAAAVTVATAASAAPATVMAAPVACPSMYYKGCNGPDMYYK
jgi:hypothetical protein